MLALTVSLALNFAKLITSTTSPEAILEAKTTVLPEVHVTSVPTTCLTPLRYTDT